MDRELNGLRVDLRILDISDITDEYANGLNDPEVNRYLVDVRLVHQTHATIASFIEANRADPGAELYGIFVRDDPRPFVGTVRISGISRFHHYASVGVCLFATRAWKKGIALEAISLVTAHAFKTIGLHYLEAGAYAENLNSIHLFERAGYSERYRVADKYRFGDRFATAVYLGIVNRTFVLDPQQAVSSA